MGPQIDVVVPTRNRLWALKRCLPWYATQECVRSVVVVDDGSDDGTCEWLAALTSAEPKLKFLRHATCRGACAARNRGADETRAPLVLFADDDLLLRPRSALTLLVEDLKKHGGDVIGPVQFFAEGREPRELVPAYFDEPGLFHYCSRRTLELRPVAVRPSLLTPGSFFAALVSGCMLVRREVIERVRYDEGLGACSYRDETDFQLKAVAAGFRILCCDRVFLADMVRGRDAGGCHRQSLLAYELQACRNNWRVLDRHRDSLVGMGLRLPPALMQAMFVIEHLLWRLPRKAVFGVVQSLAHVRSGRS